MRPPPRPTRPPRKTRPPPSPTPRTSRSSPPTPSPSPASSVTYVAETACADSRAHRFGARVGILCRLHARGRDQQGRAPGHVLLQRRSRLVVRVAAPRRARPAPREDERGRHATAAAVRTDGQRVSILDGSDLVFIDPVATGFSRPAKDQKADDFFGTPPIWIPSANSSGSGRRGMIAGSRRNISAAKVTASSAPRGWRSICVRATGCISTG